MRSVCIDNVERTCERNTGNKGREKREKRERREGVGERIKNKENVTQKFMTTKARERTRDSESLRYVIKVKEGKRH